MTLDEAADAENMEDAFAGLMAIAYNKNIEKGTPEWAEARKVFFCGAAFFASRMSQWGSEPKHAKKLIALVHELEAFKMEAESIQKLHRDIMDAGRYERTG